MNTKKLEKNDVKTFDDLHLQLIMKNDKLRRIFEKNLELQLLIEQKAKEEQLKSIKQHQKKEDEEGEDSKEDEEALKHFPKTETM